jgi:Mechanosensitive ion channel
MRWLIALGVLIGAIVVATVVSGFVRRLLDKPGADERRRQLAEPASRLLYSLLLAAGLVGALGVASPENLKPLPGNIIAFLPKLIIAMLLMILGGTVATMTANAVGTSLTKSTGKPQPALTRVVRSAVMAVITILAVSQLGVNTTVIDTIVTATVFGIAAALVLLIGLGGRNVANEVASGRYVRKLIRVGDRISCGEITGTVTAVHGVTTELEDGTGAVLHVPHAQLLSGALRIDRSGK